MMCCCRVNGQTDVFLSMVHLSRKCIMKANVTLQYDVCLPDHGYGISCQKLKFVVPGNSLTHLLSIQNHIRALVLFHHVVVAAASH